MKAITGFFSGIILLIFFSSCQKEIDWGLNNPTQNDSTTLSKMISLDTTLVSGQDTVFKLDFIYDGQKRKSGEDFTEIDNTSGIRYSSYFRYTYNNNEILPYRVSVKYNITTDSAVSFLTYNGNFIVKDSTVRFVSGIVDDIYTRYFSSLGGNRFLLRQVNFDPISGASMLVDSTIYTRTVNNNNLISGLDSSWFSPMVLNLVNSSQFSYDNRTNPLAKLTLWYLGYFENFNNIMGDNDNGWNNLLTARYEGIYPTSFTVLSAFSYTFNTAGYPVIVRASGVDGNKAFYFYTRL